MKKLFITISIIIFLIITIIIVKPFKVKENVVYVKKTSDPIIKTSLPSGGEKIEIFAFHTTQRCISCINIGKYTQEVVDQNFANEVVSKKIIYKEINIDLPENKQLAKGYEVSGSSFYITVTKDGQIFKEEDTDVWRYVPYEIKFKNYFESKIKKLL